MEARAAVLLADVVRSREYPDFRSLRDRTLAAVSSAHKQAGWIDASYAVTAWDEFQVVLPDPAHAPHAMWSLRREFHPLQLRIGLGVGAVERGAEPSKPVNLDATGDAFIRAREALEAVARRRDLRSDPQSEARTDNESLDQIVNTMLHLVDLLVLRITPGQWQTIAAVEQHARQDLAAHSLRKSTSTVSRALRRSSYAHITRALDTLAAVLSSSATVTLNVPAVRPP